MAVKIPRENRTIIFRVKDKKEFIQAFNAVRPPKEFFDQCRKAGELFGKKTK